MVTVVSKILLLVVLLGSFENAASNLDVESRGLSFLHPVVAHSNDIVEKEDATTVSYYGYEGGKGDGKGGKDMKSEKKSGKKTKFYDDSTISYDSDSNASVRNKGDNKSGKSFGNGFGKGMKSEKKDGNIHAPNDYEVEYEVVVHYEEDSEIGDSLDDGKRYDSKSSKNRPMIPDFEYIEIGYKSWKSGKAVKSEDGVYYESTGLKSGKAVSVKTSKEGKSVNAKLPKAPTISPNPTIAPAPTSTPYPTEVGSFGIDVPLYSLAYKLLSTNEPKTEELNELSEATRAYLFDFFSDEFDEDDFTIFKEFLSDILGFSASKNTPVVVDYKSVARFDQLSTITPTTVQLGSAVEEAFTGLHMIQYEDWLEEMLPSKNIFVGSKVQYYQGEGIPNTSRRGMSATGIAASAVAFTLLVAGAVLYKSKSDSAGNGIDKLNKSHGDMTVAGETFAGETFDGTSSVSAASVDYVRRYNDEEEGMEIDNLGSIPESHDTDSIKPTWSDDVDENEDKGRDLGRGIVPSNAVSAFRGSVTSAPRTTSFEDVALQAPSFGHKFQDNVMPDPSSSEDNASQMSDSELSQFVDSTRQVDNQTSGGHTLEIKSLLSMDSMDENSTSDLSVRDNSSRRLRTVAEIEALLSSELKDDNNTQASITSGTNIQTQHQMNRPRTVEEIESLLTADDDDTVVELPFSDEDESIVE